MTITASDPFLVKTDRITRDGFARVLREKAAPGVIAERDPGQYYDANQQIRTADGRHVDGLFLLGMFNHESTMGRYGVAQTTHSWGNTRLPAFGPQPIGSEPGASGSFPIYRDWLDGMKSTAARLVAPDWVYASRASIREVFDHPSGQVWAPAGDMNDPQGYLRAMLDFMNRYEDGAPVARIPRPAMIERHTTNRGGYATPRDVRLIVMHRTDNPDAQSVLRHFANPASKASSNYLIDTDGTIYEVVPLGYAPWTNGDVNQPDMSNRIIAEIVTAGLNPNPYCATIEHVGARNDRMTPAQLASSAHLSAWIAQEEELAVDRTDVVGHDQFNSVSRWYCPGWLDVEWSTVLSGAMAWGQQETPLPEVRMFAETGHGIGGGFRWFWEHNGGLMIFGYPLTDEFTDPETGLVVQYFERARFEYHPENDDPYTVLLTRLGAEALEAQEAA